MSTIRSIILEELARQGTISFARFMELALYCPNIGYYEQLNVSPGQKGDYFTSVSVGGLFGELLAYQFAEWLESKPVRQWQILEAGAHEGVLAGDILRWLQAHRPDISSSLKYWILEPSITRRHSQEISLGGLAGVVQWFDSWSALPPSGVHGFILSNELLDAMPVHRLGWDATRKRWFEWGVAIEGDDFVWARMPADQGGNVGEFGTELPLELLEVLPDGFTTEICPAAVDWWRHAAGALKTGKLIAFDYGLIAEQFFTPERMDGTLR
ncbi:MAG TPA: SAM-dependent methyltransferase, partial [Verrucomicrobiae bacterium]|nr:SAM-dependent methyltransferase [Verrucomicrobiae bacterium]